MRGFISGVGALMFALAGSQVGMAQDTFSGSVTLDSRAFPNTALFGEQHGALVSLTAEPKFFWSNESGEHTLTFSPFGRIDSGDSERTHFDVRELYWQTYGDRWELSAGLLWTFWGVTESQHLVDVINQTDQVENPDGEDKLGQPAVQGTWLADWGTIDLFLLPYFRERTFPGVEGRLRFPLVVDTDAAEVERTLGVAARWFHTLGSLDLGLSTFFGTAREPRLRITGDGEVPTGVIPLYERVHQMGIDAQLISGSWLWKLEGITRSGQGDRFFSSVAGFEYTLSNMKNTGADLGLIAEYSHDTRDAAAPADEPLSLSFFDNDLFMGGRLALNDVQSSEVLAGAVVDVDLGTVAWLIEASRRVGSTFTADLEVRAFSNADPTDPVYNLRRDSFVQLGFSFFY